MSSHRPATGFILPAVLGLLLFTGCFSIPFLGKSGPPENFQPTEREFDRDNVFVGYDRSDQPIVELRLVKQEVGPHGIIIHTRLFPTENFKVRNIFRGLRSLNYYPMERRFHRLEIKSGRRRIKAKITDNLQVKDQSPLDALFEQGRIYALFPDTVSETDLKFQDVRYWRKLPSDSLDNWYAIKENYLDELDRRQRRSSLVEQYVRRQRQDYTRVFSQHDSLYVTVNNAYVYLDRDVNSDIIMVMHAGDRLDFGISDGLWVEVPMPDSLVGKFEEMLENRRQMNLTRWHAQRQAAQARTRTAVPQPEVEIDTTFKTTAYILEVMVQPSYSRAVAWERTKMQAPVDVPLFAQVLQDRENARIARLDSIDRARADSIARESAVADSLRRALEAPDSLLPDTAQAGGIAAADSAGGAVQTDSTASLAESVRPDVSADGAEPVAAQDSSAVPPAVPATAGSVAGDNPQPGFLEGDGTGRNRALRGGAPPQGGSGSGGQVPAAPADTAAANNPESGSPAPGSP